MTLSDARRQERAERGAESWTKRYKRGGSMPAAINTHMERQHGAWETGHMTSTDLTIRTMETEEVSQAEATIIKRIPEFKNLAMRDKVKAAQIVFAYGAQPFHFNVIVFNKGKPNASHVLILNRDGVWFCGQQTMGSTFGGVESRPMTETEHAEWKLGKNQIGAVADLYKVIGSNRFKIATHIGIAGGNSERNELVTRDFQTNGPKLALKRAEVGAWNKGAPLGIDVSSFADPGDVIEGDFEMLESGQPGVTTTSLSAGDTTADTVVVEPSEPTVDTVAPELNPVKRLTKQMSDGVLKAIVAAGLTRDDVTATGLDPIQMRRDGYSPGQIVDRLYKAYSASKASQEPEEAVDERPAPEEPQEELPW